jgi:hypothetical protein
LRKSAFLNKFENLKKIIVEGVFIVELSGAHYVRPRNLV